MHSKRWRALARATVLLVAAALLPAQAAVAAGGVNDLSKYGNYSGFGKTPTTGAMGGIGVAAGKPVTSKPALAARALTLTGLADNQTASGVIDFDVNVGGTARNLYIYSQLSPYENYTSYSWGQFDARGGQVHVNFDTSFLPDGTHMVTLYTRDANNRMLALGSISIFVQNWHAETDFASHFAIAQPLAFTKQQGNAIAVKLNDLKTGKIAAYEYHLAALGFPFLVDSKVIKTGPEIAQQVPIKGMNPGWYALTVYALDENGRIIDKATVTVEMAPGK